MEIANRLGAKGLSLLSKVWVRVQPVCNYDGHNVLGGQDGMKLGTKSNQMDAILLDGDHGVISARTGGSRFESWQGRYIGGFHTLFTPISYAPHHVAHLLLLLFGLPLPRICILFRHAPYRD